MDKSDVEAGAEVKCLLPSLSVGHSHGTKISTRWFLVSTLVPSVSVKGAKGTLLSLPDERASEPGCVPEGGRHHYLQGYIGSAALRLQVILQKKKRKHVGNKATRGTDFFCGIFSSMWAITNDGPPVK